MASTESAAAAPVLWAARTALFLLLAGGAVANFLALLVFCRRPSLRSPANRFVMNLLATNLAACAALLPLLLMDSGVVVGVGVAPVSHLQDGVDDDDDLDRRHRLIMTGLVPWPPPPLDMDVLCVVGEGIAAGFCTASILGVLLIAVDQYCAVVTPMRYHTKVDSVRSAALIGSAWAASLGVGVLAGIQPAGASLWASCGARDPDRDREGATAFRGAYTAAFAIVVFLAPFSALCWIYVSICGAAKGNSERARRATTAPLPPPSRQTKIPLPPPPPLPSRSLPVSRSAPSMTIVSPNLIGEAKGERDGRRCSCPASSASTTSASAPTPTPAKCFVNTLRTRISNASLFRYREEARAARVSAVLLVMALVCWAPYALLLPLHAALPPDAAPPRAADQMALAALAAAATASPCLFAYRNRRVQREVRRLFSFRNNSNITGSCDHRGSGKRLITPTSEVTSLGIIGCLSQVCIAASGSSGSSRSSFSSSSSPQASSSTEVLEE